MLFGNKQDKNKRAFYKNWQQDLLKRENDILIEAKAIKKDKKVMTMTEEKMRDLYLVYYVGYVYFEDGFDCKVLKFVIASRLSIANRDTLLSRYEYKTHSFFTGSSTHTAQIEMPIREYNKTWFTNETLALEKIIELIKKGDCPYLNVEPMSLPKSMFEY